MSGRFSWAERQAEMFSRISDSSGSSISSRVSTVSDRDLYFRRSWHEVALSDSETCTKCYSRCAVFGGFDVETSWYFWCVPCNVTWHNRRIEGILLSVSRDFARRSLAALVGNYMPATIIFTFLQTSVACVKHNHLLLHRLNVRVLMWLGCTRRWYVENELIHYFGLRNLHHALIISNAFKTMCFPCSISSRDWTLLHAVCSYLEWPPTAHVCDSIPRREHAWHLFRWAHDPWLWNEITDEWFFVRKPPAEWQCYFFYNKQGNQIHWWLSGKRWFLEPVSPEWSLFLRNGIDVGEGGWQQILLDEGPWMRNQVTTECFQHNSSGLRIVMTYACSSQWHLAVCASCLSTSLVRGFLDFWYST